MGGEERNDEGRINNEQLNLMQSDAHMTNAQKRVWAFNLEDAEFMFFKLP